MTYLTCLKDKIATFAIKNKPCLTILIIWAECFIIGIFVGRTIGG